MLTANAIVEMLRKHTETGSDYAVGKLLGKRPQTVHMWIHKGGTMSDETALIAAKILGFDSGYVLACMAAERAKDTPSHAVWIKNCKALTPKKRRIAA